MAGFGLTGCGGETGRQLAKTEAADKQAGAPRRQIPRKMGTQGRRRPERKEVGQRTARRTKVALCLSGAANDMGWCQSAYDGLSF